MRTILVLFTLASAAYGDVILVPADRSTIQEAIIFSTKGDEIIVAPGVYHEHINVFAQAITLRSSGGPEVTTLDGDGVGTVVTMTSGEGLDTLLQGFTITGAATSALHTENSAGPTIRDCVFTGNSADLGGAILHEGGASEIYDSIFISNLARGGAAIFNNASGPLALYGCVFSDNVTSGGSGAGIMNSEGTQCEVRGCSFSGNEAVNGNGGAIWEGIKTSLIVEDSSFLDNSAMSEGGAIYSESLGNSIPTTVRRCVFMGNAAANGGAIKAVRLFSVFNSLFADNLASLRGGAIHAREVKIANCIFVDNLASLDGGGIFKAGVFEVDVWNSIFWVNTPNQAAPIEAGPTISFSDILGGWDGEGTDNINANPQFVDYPTDLRLSADSPCIDKGAVVEGNDATDLDGKPRVVDGDGDDEATIDMGAFEFQPCIPDLDGDGDVRVPDLIILLAAWGPPEGVPDPPEPVTGNLLSRTAGILPTVS